MPPWARQPTTSYWRATTSPAPSFGSNENGAPHLRQKPDVRPGAPSRPRPTGSSHRAQKRRFSGTIGLTITASAGSRKGTAGISTSPAPSRLRLPVLVPPVAVRRAEVNEVTVAVLGRWAIPGPAALAGALAGADAAALAALAGVDAAAPAGLAGADVAGRAGAMPHSSQ